MTAPIGPGAMLAGKYRVERVLGEGGMGIVVAARHTQLDQRVAVKFMRAEALSQGDGIDRFLREARAAARLTGDHVVRVIDVGTLDDGAPYIVMEYLDGRDLGSLLAERGTLPPAEASGYVLEACEAMSEAHAEGIVHRDLKPENLFLVHRQGRKPSVKVLDFGISKLLETTDALSSTRTSVMMGSPAYMSPEQMQSPKYVDGRTDVWSLGVILYQLVAGRLPFHAESVLMMSALVLTTEPPRLETVAPEVPPAFAEVVHRCLTRDLAKRFQTVDELAAALQALAPAAQAASGRYPVPATPMTASVIESRPRSWVIPAIAGAMVVAGAIAGIIAIAMMKDETPAPVKQAEPVKQPERVVAPEPEPVKAAPVVTAEPVKTQTPAPPSAAPPVKPSKIVKKKRPKENHQNDDPFGTLQ